MLCQHFFKKKFAWRVSMTNSDIVVIELLSSLFLLIRHGSSCSFNKIKLLVNYHELLKSLTLRGEPIYFKWTHESESN